MGCHVFSCLSLLLSTTVLDDNKMKLAAVISCKKYLRRC